MLVTRACKQLLGVVESRHNSEGSWSDPAILGATVKLCMPDKACEDDACDMHA